MISTFSMLKSSVMMLMNSVLSQEAGTRFERGNSGEKLGLGLAEGEVGEADGSEEVLPQPAKSKVAVKTRVRDLNIYHLCRNKCAEYAIWYETLRLIRFALIRQFSNYFFWGIRFDFENTPTLP